MLPCADIVVGLGWGDEGKGATVDTLVASTRANRVVRFNGGQQAAHNVIANGIHHTFASYGAGTFSNVPTWISHYCTINPINIYNEKRALLQKGFKPVLNVDSRAKVTTGLHVIANEIRELNRGENNHGTTGTGFGETIDYFLHHPDDTIYVEDLNDVDVVYLKLMKLRDHYINQGFLEYEHPNFRNSNLHSLANVINVFSKHFNIVTTEDLLEELQHGHTVFEGAQGFMLDEAFGFSPHTTWSNTTPSNARELCRIAGIDSRAIGCLRSYATRHGAGPIPHEGSLDFEPEEPHNGADGPQGVFRTAQHDTEMIKWAIEMTMVDALSISHLDIFNGLQTNKGLLPLESFDVPILMEAYGPQREDRKCQTTVLD